MKGTCHAPGLALRRILLIAAGLPTSVVDARPPTGASADDLLDALACAAVARRIHSGHARPFPDPPGQGHSGCQFAIWASSTQFWARLYRSTVWTSEQRVGDNSVDVDAWGAEPSAILPLTTKG